ncbi:hypothetical protein DFH09DRAFT_1091390 [Mycena vulgaris]|nr:hypothetical protein DFH09DRAFT_1091390 [Mycena vulgaris]
MSSCFKLWRLRADDFYPAVDSLPPAVDATGNENPPKDTIVNQESPTPMPAIICLQSNQLYDDPLHLLNTWKQVVPGDPQDDLPEDTQMFGKIIMDENVFLQTVPVGLEGSPTAWNLEFGCSVESRRDEVLVMVQSTENFNLPLHTVNPDGPSLEVGTVDQVKAYKYLIG